MKTTWGKNLKFENLQCPDNWWGFKVNYFRPQAKWLVRVKLFPPPASWFVGWWKKQVYQPPAYFFWCPMLVLCPYYQNPSVNKPNWIWFKATIFFLNVADLCTLSLKVLFYFWVPTWPLWVGGRPDLPTQTVTSEKFGMRLDNQLSYIPDL